MPTQQQAQTRTEQAKGRMEFLQGTFRPETINLEARTIEVVFTTGEGGRRYDWWDDFEYIEELDVTPESVRTARLDKGLSVQGDHATHRGIDNVFGITGEYRFEPGNKLVGVVRFATDEDSDKRFKKVADGILRHVSLGYRVYKYLRTQSADDKLPTMRAVDWEPTELSFVVTSFETQNGIRSRSSDELTHDVEIVYQHREGDPMDPKDKVTDSGNEPTQPVEPNRSAPTDPNRSAPTDPEQPTVPVVDADRAAADRQQLQEMIQIAVRAGLDQSVASDAFVRGETVEQFCRTALNTLGDKSKEGIVSTLRSDNRSDARENMIREIESGILIRADHEVLEGVDAARARGYATMRLLDVARSLLEANGVNTFGMSPMQVAQRAFQSTSDFPLILENVMNKSLRAGYAGEEQTWKELGHRTTVNDFREKHSYTLGDAPDLLPLNEHGEYQSGTLEESKESYRIHTFARKMGLTRQALINDDMNALSKVPTMFGSAGGRLESDVVWGMILGYNFQTGKAQATKLHDGKTLFHTDHNNLLTAGSAMSKTAMQELRKLGRKQKTIDGRTLNVTYKYIAVSEEIESVAEEVLFPVYAPNTSTDQQLRHKMSMIVEPRLAVAQANGLAWYAFAPMFETFEYAYLAGEEEMVVEVNRHTDVDGLEIKVRKDFGAGIIDYRGFAMGTGAA